MNFTFVEFLVDSIYGFPCTFVEFLVDSIYGFPCTSMQLSNGRIHLIWVKEVIVYKCKYYWLHVRMFSLLILFSFEIEILPIIAIILTSFWHLNDTSS